MSEEYSIDVRTLIQEVRQLVFFGLLVDVHAHHGDGEYLNILLRLSVRALHVHENENDSFPAVGRFGVSW